MSKQTSIEKRRKIYVLIIAIIAILILAADFLLIWTSLRNGQVARGLSRYWSQEN
jgi:flagellar basal body-associated protein FliL